MSKNFFSKFLFFGIFLFGCFLCVGARAASFGTPVNVQNITTTSTAEILWIDNIYYLAFSSSTETSDNIFITTSTNGSVWSSPVLAFDDLVGGDNGFFDFKYSSFDDYFALSALGNTNSGIYFTTSSDLVSWSAPIDTLGGEGVNLFPEGLAPLSFAPSSSLIAVGVNAGSRGMFVVTSTNQTSWGITDAIDSFAERSAALGMGISGDSGSEVLHFFYGMPSSTNFGLEYASSTDLGTSWTSSTVFEMGSGDEYLLAAASAMNSSGQPALFVQDLTSFTTGELSCSIVVDSILLERQDSGTWSSTTLHHFETEAPLSDGGFDDSLSAGDLEFNGDYPYFSYFGEGIYPFFGYRGVDPVVTSSVVSDQLGGYGLSLAYNNTDQEVGVAYVDNSGVLSFTTSTLSFAASNSAPVATAISPLQTSATSVTVTTTISDADSDVTSVAIEYSGNGTNWYPITIGSVTASVGSVTTSSGSITSIDTDVSSVNLTIVWSASTDAPSRYDGNAYLRVTPNDGTATGTVRTSSVFLLDLAEPTAPGALVAGSVSSTTVVLTLPSTTSTDTNFLEYIVYYSTSTPVTSAANAHTSSTDANLAAADFNSATSTTVSSLSPSTTYYFKLYAYDDWGNVTSSAEISTTTAASAAVPDAPTGLSATAASASQIDLSWTAVSGATYYSVYRSTDSYTTTIATTTATSYSNTSLSSGTSYSYKVSATNGNGEGDKSSVASATTQSISGGGGGSSYYIDSTAPSNVSVKINSDATSTKNIAVTLSLGASDVNSISMMISNVSDFTNGVWENYSINKEWNLVSGVGTKTVYVKFKDSYGNISAIVSDTIELLGQSTTVTTTTDSGTTTVIVTPISAEDNLVVVTDEQSEVVINPPVVYSYQPGAAIKFNYSYKNITEKPLQVRVTRQLVNSANKVVRTSSAYQMLRAGGTFSRKINEAIPSSLSAGTYTIKIKIYNARTNKLLSENSFQIEVEKLKKNYFILTTERPLDTSIAFDETSWAKIKSDVALPVEIKLKYTYTNNTDQKYVARIVREVLDANDKVVYTRTGRWTMSPGEVDSLTFVQSLGKKMVAGEYRLRIRAFDSVAGTLLAENSFGFTIEFK